MIELVILVLAIPIGFLIAWLARDELVMGRKWFLILDILSIGMVLVSAIYSLTPVFWTCAFIIIVSGISYAKSYDKHWTKK